MNIDMVTEYRFGKTGLITKVNGSRIKPKAKAHFGTHKEIFITGISCKTWQTVSESFWTPMVPSIVANSRMMFNMVKEKNSTRMDQNLLEVIGRGRSMGLVRFSG